VASETNRWTDRAVEERIGNLLRGGVILATSVVLFGTCVFLVRHGHEMPHYRAFVGTPAGLRNLPGIWENVLALKGRGLIQLGLLLLIATPVARVAFSVVAFAIQRDRLYVVLTVIVLAILTFSLAGGQL